MPREKVGPAAARAVLRVGPALAGMALAACAFTSSSPFASYSELPPPAARSTLGLWDLGDDNCKGSIQSAERQAYWVVDCRVRIGYGHCTTGLPIEPRGPGRFASGDGRITFTVRDDGTLDESKDGKAYRHYAALHGQICGAASPKHAGTGGMR